MAEKPFKKPDVSGAAAALAMIARSKREDQNKEKPSIMKQWLMDLE